MSRPFLCIALLPLLWASSVEAAGSRNTWRSPTTLDVVLVTFQDATTGTGVYHLHDRPYGTNPGEPADSSYTLRDFERLFSGGYGVLPDFVGTNQTVGGGHVLPEVFGSVRAYFDSVSNGMFQLNVRMINPTDEDGYPRWIELPETKAHYAEISSTLSRRRTFFNGLYATAMDSVRCWNPTPFPTDPDPPTCGRNSAVTGYAITDIGPDNTVAQRRRHKVVYLYSGATFKGRSPAGLLHPQADWHTRTTPGMADDVGYRYVMGEREGSHRNDNRTIDEFAPIFTHAHEIGHLLGLYHGGGLKNGPNPYMPDSTYMNDGAANLLDWGLMQGDGAGPVVVNRGYHSVYRSCPNPINPFYLMDLEWIDPTEVIEIIGNQDDYEIAPGTVHLIDRGAHEYLLERRAHDGIDGISFGRYLLYHEYDEDPGLFIWRRETLPRSTTARERAQPLLIVADGRRIRDARDNEPTRDIHRYQDMLFDPFPVVGDTTFMIGTTTFTQGPVNEVYDNMGGAGLRQTTATGRDGGEQTDPMEVGFALTNITRIDVPDGADEITVDVIFLPRAPANLTVEAGDGSAILTWNDPDDFTLDRWEYRQGGSGWVEVPVDDDQLIRVEATGTLSYTVMGLTNGEMYSFEVRAHNAAGWGAGSGPFEVTLNTAPEVMGEASPSFDEDSESTVATYTATDAEGDAITWSLTGADAAAFSPPSDATGNSFDLSFRSPPNYENPTDANLDTVYEVTVVATDDGMPPLDASYPVTVPLNNVDEEGTVTLSTTTPLVGHPLGSALGEPDGGVTDLRWQWQRRLSGTKRWEDVSSSRARSEEFHQGQGYTPKPGDVGYELRATVGYTDVHGPGKRAQSPESAPVVDVPSAPRNLEAAAGNARVDLRWDPPLTDNGSALRGYGYRYGSGGSWTPGTLGLTPSHTIDQLTNGTAYTFELWAVNGAGNSDPTSVTSTPLGVPDPPVLSVEEGDGRVRLRFVLGSDNGSGITRRDTRVYRLVDGARLWPFGELWFETAVDPSSSDYPRRFTSGYSEGWQGLTNGLEYTFEVRTVNEVGTSALARVTATPRGSPPPRPVTVTYGASSYAAQEGGEAATVRLSAPASQALRIPIAVNPPSGDYSRDPGSGHPLSFSR